MQKKKLFYLIAGVIAAAGLIFIGIYIGSKQMMSQAPPVSEITVPPTPEVAVPSVELPPAPPVVELPPVEELPRPEEIMPPVVEMPREAVEYEFQKGMSYIAWTERGYSNSYSGQSMEELKALGVDWVCLVATWYQDKIDSVRVYPLKEQSPSDQSLIFAIRKLHELGIKVMLKPHVDLIEAGGRWRGDIGNTTTEDWQEWFISYNDFILHYAHMAQENDVELFCIGTELTNAALSQPELWKDLIKKVRGVYQGKLTYAANWYREFNSIEFWNELDYVGIDPYFPLAASPNPSREDLLQAWNDWAEIIETWQKEIDRPIIFTEIGYKSSVGSADEPWQHHPGGQVDLQLQADCYKAVLETFYDKPWFYGIYWWYWGVNPRMGGAYHRGFTPQNKPAEEVIKAWYSKPLTEKMY